MQCLGRRLRAPGVAGLNLETNKITNNARVNKRENSSRVFVCHKKTTCPCGKNSCRQRRGGCPDYIFVVPSSSGDRPSAPGRYMLSFMVQSEAHWLRTDPALRVGFRPFIQNDRWNLPSKKLQDRLRFLPNVKCVKQEKKKRTKGDLYAEFPR